jgi:hypothetical protein
VPVCREETGRRGGLEDYRTMKYGGRAWERAEGVKGEKEREKLEMAL